MWGPFLLGRGYEVERRDVLRRGVAGLAALALASKGVSAAQAVGHGCYEEKPGHVRCQVGFPSAPFIEPQACRPVCWANCVAYLLRGYGAKISVESVVQKIDVPGDCRRRDDAALIMRAGGQWRDDTGRAFLVKMKRFRDIENGSYTTEEFQPLVTALSRRPLITGVSGHSFVLTQMDYIDAPMVMMRQDRLTVRDPWSGTPNLRTFAYDELPERMFVIGLEVREI